MEQMYLHVQSTMNAYFGLCTATALRTRKSAIITGVRSRCSESLISYLFFQTGESSGTMSELSLCHKLVPYEPFFDYR